MSLVLLLSAVATALALAISCRETDAGQLGEMCNKWVNTSGKPPFILQEEDDRYHVTVVHRNHKGGGEAKTYLVREAEGVLFVEAGFAVMVDYGRKKNRIRLPPDGECRGRSDGILEQ